VSGTLQYASKAYSVKFYGLECWGWAVVGSDNEIFKKHQALVSPSEHKLIRQTMPDELFNKTRQSDLRWKAETNI
jgi:hypothetical protein